MKELYHLDHLSSWSFFHLVARRYKLPIISDETYAEMVFTGQRFYSVASVTTDVPTLVCGGVSKRFLVPGWRLGWILIHDPIEAFKNEVCYNEGEKAEHKNWYVQNMQ